MSDKHFLIPVDSTPFSNHALSYLATMFSRDEHTTFHLIHCQSAVSASIIPPPVDSDKSLFPDSTNNSLKTFRAKTLLNKKCQFLQDRGINKERIQSSVIGTGSNVSSTIIHEAEKQLADAVVIARRGVGFIGEMVMGSLSATLFRELHTIPLWVIDGEVTSPDVLIGVDGSIHSLRAVEHLGHFLANRTDITIYLYHCSAFLAPEVVCSLDSFYREWDREWCDKHLVGSGCLFNGPTQVLLEAGIPDGQIIILPETKNIEESNSIISQAGKFQCGTIVIGRKGPDSPKGFFGGVSNRTIRQTQNMAVWIIG